jgi:hypothetical protein
MEIDTKGIYEIKQESNKIILIYRTERDAFNAHFKQWKECSELIEGIF